MFRRLIINLIVNAFCIYAVANFLPSLVKVEGGLKFYIISAFLIGILNSLVKPIIKLISFPFIFITGGLFLIVINSLILWILSYLLAVLDFQGVSFAILGLKGYIYAGIIFGLINWFQHWLFKIR